MFWCFFFFLSPRPSSQGQGEDTFFSLPTPPPVSIPADGTRDKAMNRLGRCCFSLFGVTVSRLCWAGTVPPTRSCADGAGLFCRGSLWFLEMGSFSFLHPLPTAHSTQRLLGWREPSQRPHLSCVPFDPRGKFTFPPRSGGYLSEHCS